MTRRRSRRAPTAQTAIVRNAAAATTLLLVLGAGVRAGEMTAHFWQETAGRIAALLAGAAVVWFAALAPSASLHRLDTRQRQMLAYLATAAGLSFLVARFWLAAAATTAAAAGAAAWLPLVDAAVLPLLAAATALQALLLSPLQWDARRLGVREINLVVLLSVPAILLMPGGAAGWSTTRLALPNFDGAAGVSGVTSAGAPWLAAVIATGVALLCGQSALHVLRRPGAAAMVFAAVLFYQSTANFVFAQTSGASGLDATAHFLAFLAAVVMDAVYMIRIYAAGQDRTLWYALAAGIITATGATLILLPSVAGYPAATPAVIVGVTAGCTALGAWCGWCGARLGALAVSR